MNFEEYIGYLAPPRPATEVAGWYHQARYAGSKHLGSLLEQAWDTSAGLQPERRDAMSPFYL